jgi:hypothetical protein
MLVDLRKLPFAFLSNANEEPFTGTLHIACVLTELSPNATEPVIEAVNAWVRTVNDQFLTTADQDSDIEAAPFGQVAAHTMLIVKAQCAHVESTAWLVLLGLLAQIQHTYGVLRMLQLQLDTGAAVVDATAATWPTVACSKLFSRTNRPACFDAINDLALDETLDLSMELKEPLDKDAFDRIQGSLQLLGYLLVMGALHFDFQEHKTSNETLGRISQLTPLWFEYSKDNYDAPRESLLLVDHWTKGLGRRNIGVTLTEISQ